MNGPEQPETFRAIPGFVGRPVLPRWRRLSVLACCAAVGVPAPPPETRGIRAQGVEVDLSVVPLSEALRKAATPEALQAVVALTWEARGASEATRRKWRRLAEARLGELRAAALVGA